MLNKKPSQIDKAGTKYWDKIWEEKYFPKLFNLSDQSLNNYINQNFHIFFKKNIKPKKKIIELGCAGSIWPVYFNNYFSSKVSGLDYSKEGCFLSKKILEFYKIKGDIYCSDLFKPPPSLQKKYDYVVSFGLVEHFENTADCLKNCSRYLKDNGIMITFIPNMNGIPGFLQKLVDKDIFDIHVPLSKEKFEREHHKAGLEIKSCNFFLPISLCALNSGKFSKSKLEKSFRKFLSITTKSFWIAERYGLRIQPNKVLSPYLFAISKKKK